MPPPDEKPKRRASRDRDANPPHIEEELDAELAALDRDVEDPTLIPGIYNYCDRWCERCPFTERCLTYRTEKRRRTSNRPKSSDPANEAFWDDVSHNFAIAMQMLEREAKKLGIDLDALDARARASNEERRRRRRAAREDSTLHGAATQYWKLGQKLLEDIQPSIADLDEEFEKQVALGVGQPEATVAALTDAIEIIEWYLFFIDVKLQRAISSRVDEHRDDIPAGASDEAPSRPNDSDGSAKVALISIDRSISAWARLRGHLGAAHGDAILDLLVHLERLRRAVETEFPLARSFRRPGFDQPAAGPA